MTAMSSFWLRYLDQFRRVAAVAAAAIFCWVEVAIDSSGGLLGGLVDLLPFLFR